MNIPIQMTTLQLNVETSRVRNYDQILYPHVTDAIGGTSRISGIHNQHLNDVQALCPHRIVAFHQNTFEMEIYSDHQIPLGLVTFNIRHDTNPKSIATSTFLEYSPVNM